MSYFTMFVIFVHVILSTIFKILKISFNRMKFMKLGPSHF